MSEELNIYYKYIKDSFNNEDFEIKVAIVNYLEMLKELHPDAFGKFISAPASTRFHGVYEGGLFEHSVNVVKYMWQWKKAHKGTKLTTQDCIVVGLLHDMCKYDLYSKTTTKDGKEKWTADKELAKRHARRSIELIKYIFNIKLTRLQKVLILLHMNGWENKEDFKALNILDKLWLLQNENLQLLQVVNWADMKATAEESAKENIKQ